MVALKEILRYGILSGLGKNMHYLYEAIYSYSPLQHTSRLQNEGLPRGRLEDPLGYEDLKASVSLRNPIRI